MRLGLGLLELSCATQVRAWVMDLYPCFFYTVNTNKQATCELCFVASCSSLARNHSSLIMAPRARFPGDVRSLLEIYKPWVTQPAWLQYGEEKARVDRTVIKKFMPLILKLREIQPNLSFKKKTMCVVFATLLDCAPLAKPPVR